MLPGAMMSKTDVVAAILEPENQRGETKKQNKTKQKPKQNKSVVNAMKQSNGRTPISFFVGSVMLVQFCDVCSESFIPYSVCYLITVLIPPSYGYYLITATYTKEYSTFVETGLDPKKTSICYQVLITYSSYWH